MMMFLKLASTSFALFVSPQSSNNNNRGISCTTINKATKLFISSSSSSSPTTISSNVDDDATMDSSSNMQEKYNKLLEWLKKSNANINDKIIIGPSDVYDGYGVFVTDDVDENEILFEIPRSCCITLKDATSDIEGKCGEKFQALIDKVGPGGNTVVLAGYMAKEYLKMIEDEKYDNNNNNANNAINELQQYRDGSSALKVGKFGPYLNTLPWERFGPNNQEHIIFWNDEEFDELLKGTFCYKEAKGLRDEVQLATTVLNGMIGGSILSYRSKKRGDGADNENNNNGGFKFPWQKDSDEATKVPSRTVKGLPKAVKGAFVSILTRAFQDDDSSSETKNDNEKMVPLLDMVNHADIPNISHKMITSVDDDNDEKKFGTIQVRAKRSIESGEELLNQYRSEEEENMPYHRFFTRFGFVPGLSTDQIQDLIIDESSIFYPKTEEV